MPVTLSTVALCALLVSAQTSSKKTSDWPHSREGKKLVRIPEPIRMAIDDFGTDRSLRATERRPRPRNTQMPAVYVVDTGVRAKHIEFHKGQVDPDCSVDFRQFRGKKSKPFVGRHAPGHGTCIASLIAGHSVGVFRGGRICSVRVFGRDGRAESLDVARAIKWSAENCALRFNGSCLINVSASADGNSLLDKAVAYAKGRWNVTVLTAAGNIDGRDSCRVSPCRAAQYCVGSADPETGDPHFFSGVGECVDVWRDGYARYCAMNQHNRDYALYSGTSMATAVATGELARDRHMNWEDDLL